jgi:hypothetical protein
MYSHKEIVIQLLNKEFGIVTDFEMKATSLADIKFNKPVSELILASLILDFIDRYIVNRDDIFKLEKIKVDRNTGNLVVNKIVWFVYKSFKENKHTSQASDVIKPIDNQTK